jgi:tetratricopeptide (TPR) repeat protein
MRGSRVKNRIESLGLWYFGLALPLLFFPPAEDAYRLAQLLSLGLASACLAFSSPRLGRPSGLALLGLGYFALRLISQAQGGFKAAWSCEQLLYAWIFYWASQHPEPPRLWQYLKPALLGGAALASAYGILQAFGIDPWERGQMPMGFGRRAHASLGNPDFFGGYLALIFPLAMGDAIFKAKRPWLALLIGAALVFSQTRAAWLASAAGLAILAWQGRARLGWGRLAALALSLAVLGALSPHQSDLAKRLGSALDPGTSDASGRIFLYKVTAKIALEHPLLGSGGGNFTDAFLQAQGPMLSEPGHAAEPYRMTHDAHNDWLQVAAESGLPALALLLLLWGLLFKGLWRLKNGQAWALSAALGAFAVDALFSFPMAVPASAGIFWMLAGISTARLGPPAPAAVPALPFALAVTAALFLFLRLFQASIFLNHGMRQSLAGHPETADPVLHAARRIHADDYRAWLRLGLNADASGDFESAALEFQGAIRALPGMASAWSNLGLALAKAGDLDGAEKASLEALRLNPRFVEALGNLGKIHYLKGRLSQAEDAYRRGLKIDPAWVHGRYNLAAICVNSDRKAEAREILKELLVLDPRHAQALQLLKALK